MIRRQRLNKVHIEGAVREGVARGMTAKEASFEFSIHPSTLTNTAKKLGLAFKWAKVAKVPTHMPVPVQTLLNREQDINRQLVRRMTEALASIPKDNPAYIILTDSIGLARRKSLLRS